MSPEIKLNMKEAVQNVVNNLYLQYGEVKPSILVEIAKPKDNPAHDAFEWDNKKAGDEYRLMQARQWIRRVEIILPDRTERLIHVPKIVSEENGEDREYESNEGYYKPISIVQKSDWEYKAALQELLNRLNATRIAYMELKKASERTKPKSKLNFDRIDKGFNLIEAELG